MDQLASSYVGPSNQIKSTIDKKWLAKRTWNCEDHHLSACSLTLVLPFRFGRSPVANEILIWVEAACLIGELFNEMTSRIGK